MPSVLVADPVEKELIIILEKAGIGVELAPAISPTDLLSAIKCHEGLVVRSRTKVTEDVLDAANNLKIIGRAGVGVENINVPAATERGIAVVNAPYSNIHSVGEQVVHSMLNMYRPLNDLDKAVKAGEWPKGSVPITELRGKRVGILGYGNVGEVVAEKLGGLGVEIVYYDPYTGKAPPYPHYSLGDLFARCDIVTVHAQGESAAGIVTQKLLESMPTGAVFINTSRPEVLEKGALENALRRRTDLRAAIDVHEDEKPGNKPLAKFGGRAILTPHVAGSSTEAQMQAALDIGNQVSDYLRTGIAAYFVNKGTIRVPHEAYPHLRTAWSLARLVSSWNGDHPRSLEIVPDRELMRYSDAIARAAAIGHQRAIAQESNWLRTEPYENVTIGHGEDKSPYRSFVVVTANPGDPHNEVSAVGSLNSEGVPVLRRVEEYSGDARNAYGNLSHPLVGANAFFVYEGGRGALRVLTGMAEQHDVNIVGTSHGESGDRRYAFAALTLEGDDSDLNTLYSDVRNLRYLDTAPKGVPRQLKIHHAFVIP